MTNQFEQEDSYRARLVNNELCTQPFSKHHLYNSLKLSIRVLKKKVLPKTLENKIDEPLYI